jgi:serine protease Do
MRKFAFLILVSVFGGIITLSGYKLFIEKETKLAQENTQQIPTYLTKSSEYFADKNSLDFTHAAEMTVHSVVHVKTSFEIQTWGYASPFDYFFRGAPQQLEPQKQQASGSGVIISSDGYILTNNHVIEKADNIEIVMNNKSTYKATLVGTDPTTDLALLKIEGDNYPFVKYGNSDEVKVGEWVLAVGNPFNLTSTVTAGIVSAKSRSINILNGNAKKGVFPIESFIQTDAAVNPGNSGGALVNTRGELVGINTAIASNTGSYTGYSFAIPVNIAQKVANDLMEFGIVQRAFLGVTIQDIDGKFAEEKKLNQIKGVYVNGLLEDGAADKAGLKQEDIILKIAKVNVNSVPELQEIVSRYRPGDVVDVTVLRKNKEMVVPVTLKNKNNTTEVVKKEVISKEIIAALGAEFDNVSDNDKARLRISKGAKITKLGNGKLKSAGIKDGYIILKIDGEEIENPEDVILSLQNKKGGVLIEGIYSNGIRAYYGIGM